VIERAPGDIIATASIAGLVPVGMDPVEGLTKHAVVGFVRSVAGTLDGDDTPDVCISAICPGFTDTNIIGEAARTRIGEIGLEIMPPERIAETVTRSLDERIQGAQWVVWPGAETVAYDWNPPVELPTDAP